MGKCSLPPDEDDDHVYHAAECKSWWRSPERDKHIASNWDAATFDSQGKSVTQFAAANVSISLAHPGRDFADLAQPDARATNLDLVLADEVKAFPKRIAVVCASVRGPEVRRCRNLRYVSKSELPLAPRSACFGQNKLKKCGTARVGGKG